jgi:hypothetical protein
MWKGEKKEVVEKMQITADSEEDLSGSLYKKV